MQHYNYDIQHSISHYYYIDSLILDLHQQHRSKYIKWTKLNCNNCLKMGSITQEKIIIVLLLLLSSSYYKVIISYHHEQFVPKTEQFYIMLITT